MNDVFTNQDCGMCLMLFQHHAIVAVLRHPGFVNKFSLSVKDKKLRHRKKSILLGFNDPKFVEFANFGFLGNIWFGEQGKFFLFYDLHQGYLVCLSATALATNESGLSTHS